MNKLISVIIPIYNRENVIEECLDSVFAQSYQNFEIVLVDDGSTDNTFNICKSLSEKDNRIKLYSAQHGGVSAARNIAIEKSNGDFLFFLDSDDIIHPLLLETMLTSMENQDVGISGTYVINISSKNWNKTKELIEKDVDIPEISYHNNSESLELLFTGKSPINLIGGTMIRRSLISETRFNTELFIGEDYYFIYENLIKNTTTAFINKKWYYCRIHSNNSSWNYTFEAFLSRFNRRMLVWKKEEENKRYKFANLQKMEAVGCYNMCISKNNYHGEEVKKMCNYMKKYIKEISLAYTGIKKLYLYSVIYFPITQLWFLKLKKILKHK